MPCTHVTVGRVLFYITSGTVEMSTSTRVLVVAEGIEPMYPKGKVQNEWVRQFEHICLLLGRQLMHACLAFDT